MFQIASIVPHRSSVVKAVGVLTLGYLVYRGAVRFARNDITVYVTELVHLPPFINPVQFANTSLNIEGKVEVETRLVARCQFHLKLAALLRDKSLSSPNTEKESTSADANQLSVSSRHKTITGAYDSNSYSKDSNSFKEASPIEYNTTSEVNQMFAQFTPIRRRRVHSAWSSFFFDKSSSLAGSSDGSDWMSSLQHTFHGNANNPFIYSNSLGNRRNDNNNNNDDTNRKSKNNYISKKSKSSAKYRTVQGQETTPYSYSYYQQEYPEPEYQEGEEEELEQFGNKSSYSNPAARRTALPLLDVNSIHTMIDRANLWLHENKNTFITFSPACVMSSMLFRYNCQNYTAKSLLETLNHKPYIDMDSTARQLPLQVTDCYVERDSSCMKPSRCFRVSFVVHVNPNFSLHDLKIIITLPSKQCKVVRVSTGGVGEFVHPVGNHTEICAWDVGSITNTHWKQLLHSASPESSVPPEKKIKKQQHQKDNQQEAQNKDEMFKGGESNNNNKQNAKCQEENSWHLEESLENSNSNTNENNKNNDSKSNKLESKMESMNVSESVVRAFNSDLWAVQFSLVYEMPQLSGTTVPLSPLEMPWGESTRENTKSESDSESDQSSTTSNSSNNSDHNNYIINTTTSRSPSQRTGQINLSGDNNNNFMIEEMTWQTPMSITRESISRQGDSSTKRSNTSTNTNNSRLPESTQITNFISDQQEREYDNKSRQRRTHKHHSSNSDKSRNKRAHKDSKVNELHQNMSNKARKRTSRALRKQEQREQLMNIAHGLTASSLSQEDKIIPKVELTYRLSSLASGAVVRKLQIVEQEDNWQPRTLLDHIALKRVIHSIRKSPKSKVNRFAHYTTWVVQPVVVRVI